jgi:Protein of unknown function (DUF3606)
MITSKPKPSRNCVDISNKVSVRQWRKRLGKSAEEVEAAVAKVGNNAETVIKELEAKHRYG